MTCDNGFGIEGKVAIITGGGRGLGFAVAKRLASAGAQTVIVDILPAEKIAPSLEELAACGPEPLRLNLDISKQEECAAIVQRTVDAFGRVDILVNNAAITKGTWEQVIGVNMLAQYNLNTAVFEDMKKRGYGKIVNITTSGTFSGGGDGVMYNATKGAADSMTRYLAKRFAAEGVNINAVAPGPVLTEMMENYYGREVFTQHYLSQIPLGRLLVPDDIAKVVFFLCSSLSDALCGETILADGGRVRLNP